MTSFRKFPTDHRQHGRHVETLHDGSRVHLEISARNRHPRGNELVKLHMNMQMGRASGYYVEEPLISLFFEHRQRVDVEVLPQGYRYGRYFDRSLRALCEKVADALVPAPRASSTETAPEPLSDYDEEPSETPEADDPEEYQNGPAMR